MRTSILRGLAIPCLLALLLSGCSKKKYEAKIKELEENIETIESEYEERIEEQDDELSEIERAKEDAEEKSTEKIGQLTEEINTLKSHQSDLQQKLDRVKAELYAKTPKDASVPGHKDFDPAEQEKFSNAMATISGDSTKGAGFIVEDAGKYHLYTTAAILSGNTRLTIATAGGTKLTKFGNLEVADGCDFVRLELQESDNIPALQLASADSETTTTSKLCCMGIAPANGSVTSEIVSPFGQGDETINLDPSKLTGKTGGPVIDTVTGKVLAIVTTPASERSDLWSEPADNGAARLTVSRINRTLSWQTVSVAAFLSEGKAIVDFDRFTKVVVAFAALAPSPEGLGVDTAIGNSETVNTVLSEATGLPVAAETIALHTLIASNKSRMGEADLKKRITSIFATVNSQSKRSVADFTPAKFSSYHRKAAEQSLKWREDADQRLKSTIEGIADLVLKPVVEKTLPRDRNDNRRNR
ncbi:MAG: hypothetical protein K9N23_17125 [Akkermansiaceae bacterium]|nr:hypothetical protein [Akkermansiaceae bacterium]